MRAALLLPLALALAACSGPLSESRSLFEKGHYAEAKQALAAIDRPGRRWTVAERARFTLYRGLTLGALGDRGRAAESLREARSLEVALDGDDTAMLEQALDTYGVR